MLTISFDPRYPQGALEVARDLLAMLDDHASLRRDFEMPDHATAGLGHVFDAIADTMERVTDALNRFMAGPDGRVQPMERAAPVPAADPVPQVARDTGLPEAEVRRMLAEGMRAARPAAARPAAPAAPASAPPRVRAPKLTEPRAAAPKRRRAA